MITLPPFDTGGVKLTVALALPLTAVTAVGAPGTVAGITVFDGNDGALVPDEFSTVTVNEYDVPFTSPVTVSGLAAPVTVLPPGLDVTVYDMTAALPFGTGGAKLTVALALPGIAVTAVGGLESCPATTAVAVLLNAELPYPLEASIPFLSDLLGYSNEELLSKHLFWELVLFKDVEFSKDVFLQLQTQAYIRYEDLPLETKGGKKVDVEFVSNVYQVGGKKVIQCNIRDISERKRMNAEVKILRGLLPICASCKQIRDDKGYWHKIESYIRDHSEAEFSHGICPKCAERLYPEFNPYKNKS